VSQKAACGGSQQIRAPLPPAPAAPSIRSTSRTRTQGECDDRADHVTQDALIADADRARRQRPSGNQPDRVLLRGQPRSSHFALVVSLVLLIEALPARGGSGARIAAIRRSALAHEYSRIRPCGIGGSTGAVRCNGTAGPPYGRRLSCFLR